MKGTPKSAPAQTEMQALSESFFRKLASSVPGILFTYQLSADRRHHAFPYISDRVRDVFGIEPVRLHGDADPMFALIAPDDLDGIR